jgi:hypothetical protein
VVEEEVEENPSLAKEVEEHLFVLLFLLHMEM